MSEWTDPMNGDRLMATQVTVEGFRRWGAKGWTWQLRVADGQLMDARTNAQGEGLFARPVEPADGDYSFRQSQGALQFALDSDDEARARRQLTAHLGRQYAPDPFIGGLAVVVTFAP